MCMEKWIVSIYGNGTIFGKGNSGASEKTIYGNST